MTNGDELQEGPGPLIACFERCQNYPRDLAGVLSLAQGLRKASDKYSITMEAIVERCRVNSVYCPTDADLDSVALSMRVELDRVIEEKRAAKEKQDWIRENGPPRPWTGELDAAVEAAKRHQTDIMWRAIRAQFGDRWKRHGAIPWPELLEMKARLGYAISPGELKEYSHEAGREFPKQIFGTIARASPITEADVDRERKRLAARPASGLQQIRSF
jgi:hypothetical protein